MTNRARIVCPGGGQRIELSCIVLCSYKKKVCWLLCRVAGAAQCEVNGRIDAQSL